MSENILCEVCQERPATHHWYNANTGKSDNLCAECFETNASPETRKFTSEMAAAHCQYCGGKPFAGGTDILALATGVQKMKFMCMPCSFEHNRYLQHRLQKDASGLSQPEQLALLRKLDEEADEHMKRWVSDRKSR